jgi:hypothetical protein
LSRHLKYTTGQNAVLQLEADAAHYGVIRSTDKDGRRHFLVTCGQCNRQQNTFNSTFDHVDEILSHFRKQGWQFDYKVSPYCTPQCQRSAKKAKQAEEREKKRVEEMNHKPQAPPLPAPVAAPSMIGPNPKIVVKVITMLNEHFDLEKRLYRSGWSDERIAKEADTSLSFVMGYREDAYAKLAEEPAATKLREDIQALEDLQAQHVAEINAKIAELKARLDKWTGAYNKAQG